MVALAPIKLDDSVRIAWSPRERISVSTWADRHRVLQATYSAEPGQWRTARTPYLAEIMDSYSLPHVEQIAILSSARVGKSETLNNMLGYTIDQAPGPVLFVQPTESAAKEECKDRIAVFIKNSPRLADHIPHTGWATQTTLDLGSTRIYMAWAASQTTLVRRTIMIVFIDELDNCNQQAGHLGDTLLLATERVTTYKGRSKVVIASTPTTAGGSAWKAYESSDRRKYYVPCPECGTYQVLRFDQIKVDDGQRDPDIVEREDLAYYECEHCKAKLKDSKHKRWMTERGVWIGKSQEPEERLPLNRAAIVKRSVFDHPDRWTPQLSGEPIVSRKIGFHIWSAYSPWRSWSQILAKWFEIKDQGVDEKRVFKNSWLGEPWEEIQRSTSTARLRDKVLVGLPRLQIPDAAQMITLSCDIQRDRAYYGAYAWGPYCEHWLIDHGVTYTFDEEIDICDALDYIWRRYFVEIVLHRGGNSFRPHIMAVDSGDQTQTIYQWCAKNSYATAIKGESTKKPVLVRRASTSPKRGSSDKNVRDLWLVNTNHAKETLYSWSNIRGDGPNVMHLHNEVDDEWIHQFASEHQVTEKGQLLWKTKTQGRDNHYLDVAVYGLAAAEIIHALEIRPPQKTEEKSPRLPAEQRRPVR